MAEPSTIATIGSGIASAAALLVSVGYALAGKGQAHAPTTPPPAPNADEERRIAALEAKIHDLEERERAGAEFRTQVLVALAQITEKLRMKRESRL